MPTFKENNWKEQKLIDTQLISLVMILNEGNVVVS